MVCMYVCLHAGAHVYHNPPVEVKGRVCECARARTCMQVHMCTTHNPPVEVKGQFSEVGFLWPLWAAGSELKPFRRTHGER